MSWNGSNSAGASVPASKKPAKKSPGLTHGLIASAAIILIGIIALYFIGGESDEPKFDKKTSTQIAEVDPEIAPPIANEVVDGDQLNNGAKECKIDKNKLYRDANGKVIFHPEFPVGSPANPIRLAPIEKPGNILPPKKLYDTFAENYVVSILRTKPGMPVVNTALPSNFDEQFIARIADPVGIKDDDNEEDIEMRKTMVDVKRQMAQLISEGMKPSQIILEEREKLNKLADARKFVLREISDLRKSGAGQEDIDLMVEAANTILSEKGIPEIRVPAMLRGVTPKER